MLTKNYLTIFFIYIRGKKATRRQARPKTHKRAGKRQTALKNPHDYSGSRSRAATRLRTSIVMAERKKDEQLGVAQEDSGRRGGGGNGHGYGILA